MKQEKSPPSRSEEIDPRPPALARMAIALLAVALVAWLVPQWLRGRGQVPLVASAATQDVQATVELVVASAAGSERSWLVPCPSDATVLSVMELARKDGFVFQVDGAGEGAFVTEIAGIRTGDNGRHWKYRVDGEPGLVSCGIRTVVPSQRILWELSASE